MTAFVMAMSDEKKFRIYLCGGPTCTPKGRDALLRTLQDELWAWELEDVVDVRVSGCQDRCDYAPNMTVWPGPYHYSALTPAAIKQIVEQHLLNGQLVREYLLGEEARR
jgi:(2Fe-2S) ferredoxin